MTRRSGQLGWGAKNAGGLYGGPRGSRLGRPVVLGLIVLGVLAIGVFLFTRVCGGSSCDRAYCESGREIRTPEGFERVSSIFEYNKSQKQFAPGLDISVTLPLTKATDDRRNLSFYRYVPETDTWEPLTPAALDANGKQVSGTFNSAPEVLTVMRRLSPAGHVVAYLAHNAPLHHDAAGKITVLHTNDFKPAADGTVQGDLSSIKPDASVAFYPMISASAGDKGTLATLSGILSNAQGRSNHVLQVLKKVSDAQLAGIDIAYLDLPADQRTSFTLFIAELSQQLHAAGKTLSLTLPAPLKAQDRIDEGAYDWTELGKYADILQMTPYRDQGTFRQTMPEILDYLTARVPATKLVLTVTPYATEKSAEGIRTMAITEAMSIATKLGIRSDRVQTNSNVEVYGPNIDRGENLTGVKWDEATATVAFTYKQGAINRTIWIENFFSLGFKLEFITRYRLGGVAVEDASENPLLGNIWTGLIPFVTSGQPLLMQPNPQDLVPKWKASKGTVENVRYGTVKWSTPAEAGTYTVNLTLSDGVSWFENEIPVNVQAKEAPTGTATAGAN